MLYFKLKIHQNSPLSGEERGGEG